MIFVTLVQAISIMTSSSLARRPRPIKIKNINSFKRSNRRSRKNIRRWKILLFQNKKKQKIRFLMSRCVELLTNMALICHSVSWRNHLMGIQRSWKGRFWTLQPCVLLLEFDLRPHMELQKDKKSLASKEIGHMKMNGLKPWWTIVDDQNKSKD